MKKLEQVRLEVDSRRHTVSQLAQKIEKQRNKLTAAGDRQKGEDNLEATIRRMQHKENKLAGARPCQCSAACVSSCRLRARTNFDSRAERLHVGLVQGSTGCVCMLQTMTGTHGLLQTGTRQVDGERLSCLHSALWDRSGPAICPLL